MPILMVPLTTAGAILDVEVAVSPSLAPFSGPPISCVALIDTGADMTAISPDMVATLKPLLIGIQPIKRADGSIATANTYEVRVRFGGTGGEGRSYSVEAVEARPATPGVDMLIGVDLLLRLRMLWDGRGRILKIVH